MIAAVDLGRAVLVVAVLVLVVLPGLLVALVVAADRVTGRPGDRLAGAPPVRTGGTRPPGRMGRQTVNPVLKDARRAP